MLGTGRYWLFAGAALVVSAPAMGQATGPSDPAVAPPPVAKAVSPEKRVYTLADFARFAPKTAFDMLAQVPGFTIQTVDTSTRGLGQASENVLINGQRVNNKSGGAVDQLQRTPATNVERIEILDAASLGIAGLTGQVANVILNQTKKSSGQFEYRANARAQTLSLSCSADRSAIPARRDRWITPCPSRTAMGAAALGARSSSTTRIEC